MTRDSAPEQPSPTPYPTRAAQARQSASESRQRAVRAHERATRLHEDAARLHEAAEGVLGRAGQPDRASAEAAAAELEWQRAARERDRRAEADTT